MKTIRLGDVFSANDLEIAETIGPDKERLKEEFVVPRMEHINRITGQDNDPDYWSYLLVWALSRKG